MPSFTFRVQALGGKFLADDIGGAWVTIKDALTGELLDSGVTRGDSGTLVGPPPSPPPATPSPAQVRAASKSVIALADGSASWWLVPGANSSSFVSSIDATEPRRVRVTVRGPVGGLSGVAEIQEELWLLPDGSTQAGDPGHVLVLPGLLVEPTAPLLHTQVQPGQGVSISAKVTMMCGCQVAAGGYWPQNDFFVLADILQITSTGTTLQQRLPMLFNPAQPSTFTSLVAFMVPGSGTGTNYYQATIFALQKGTGNSGSATVNFYCSY